MAAAAAKVACKASICEFANFSQRLSVRGRRSLIRSSYISPNFCGKQNFFNKKQAELGEEPPKKVR